MRPFLYFKKSQKFISVLLIVSLVTIPLTYLTFPKKAEAVCTPFPVKVPPNPLAVLTDGSLDPSKIVQDFQQSTEFLKTCVLNGLATVIAKQIIKQLTGSIVRWINSGFKGNPSFVQNPGKFFGAIGDQVAGSVIEKIAPFLCSPFRLNIQLALALSQTSSTQDQLGCTLTDVENNFNNFTSGNGGGWNNWFQITQNPQNNPYGAAMIASAQLNLAVETADGKYQQQLNMGKGFLSFESCPKKPASNIVSGTAGEVKIPGGGGTPMTYNPSKTTNNINVQLADNAQSNQIAGVGGSLGLLDDILGKSKRNTLAAVTTSGGSSPTASQNASSPIILAPLNEVGNYKYLTQEGATRNSSKPVYYADSPNQAVYGVQATNDGCITQTPGAVVESQLESSLGSDIRGLEIAQSIDQIFAALVGQLVSQAMGGIGGLLGAGHGSSSSGSSSNFNYQNSVTGGNAAIIVPDLPITGACTPSTQNAQIGGAVTWNMYVPDINGTVTYTWYGEGLSSNTKSATAIYTSNGAKTARVIVSTTGTNPQSVPFDCTPSVNIGDVSTSTNNAPTISCAVSPSSVAVGQPITWQAVVIGGSAPFNYSWTGDEGLNSLSQSTVKSYATAGSKTATVSVTGNDGATYTQACATTVTVTP